MQFRLLYEGPIAPRLRINVADIHQIRMQLHPQVKALWRYKPLSYVTHHLRETAPQGEVAILERSNDVLFAPLVTGKNHLACELSITLLRQQAPGQLLGEGGDIDNRLKTLLDALRMPNTAEAQQAKIDTRDDDDPIHCLLQDDGLVTKVSVETDRLLRPVPADNSFDLVAIIQVRVFVSGTPTWANISFDAQIQ
jgi:hypothetical protein